MGLLLAWPKMDSLNFIQRNMRINQLGNGLD